MMTYYLVNGPLQFDKDCHCGLNLENAIAEAVSDSLSVAGPTVVRTMQRETGLGHDVEIRTYVNGELVSHVAVSEASNKFLEDAREAYRKNYIREAFAELTASAS